MVWEQEVYKKNTGLFKWNINLVALHYIPQIFFFLFSLKGVGSTYPVIM